MDYLEVAHVFERRPHSSRQSLDKARQAHCGAGSFCTLHTFKDQRIADTAPKAMRACIPMR